MPWRKTHDPYKILVSEVMLQQTQVDRVIPFYVSFIKQFPTAKRLAAAPLSDVLAAWSGLGYNRRAKLLREAAASLSKLPYGIKKIDVAELEKLPGVGAYTARAVAAFAHNANVVFVETNIRTAVIHHFFKNVRRRTSYISDAEIKAVLEEALPKGRSLLRQGYEGRAREWYSALMDYGAHLKRSGVRINARSVHYAKQAKFAGSLREVRGAILQALTKGESLLALKKKFPDRFVAALAGLAKDDMIKKKGRGWDIA